MNFFQHQTFAKRKTGLLLLLLVVATASVVLATCGAVELLVLLAQADKEGLPKSIPFEAHFVVALGVLTFIGAGTCYKLVQLREGGEAVARLLGGRRVSPHTTDTGERRALNIVEEMAIASGIPVPLLYVLPSDDSINAFAAGFSINDAVVGVTRGCIDRLSREELQGVIAHEFSHILHGDMQLNLKLIGILHGILLVGLTGQMIMRLVAESRSGNSKNDPRPAIFLFGLSLFVIGFVGFFFGRIIKAAVSRQREFLADASAVQYTRNPNGIGGALKKIGVGHASLQSRRAEEVSHMLFADGASSWLAFLLSTHPPLMERVKRIEGPLFDEKPSAKDTYVQVVSSNIGEISPSSLSFAANTRETLGSLKEAHASRSGAAAIVYSLVLGSAKIPSDGAVSNDITGWLKNIQSEVASLPRKSKLPLFEMALPELRSLSPSDKIALRKNVEKFIESDGQVSLFEFLISQVLTHYLDSVEEPFTKERSISSELLASSVSTIISFVALQTDGDPKESFNSGLKAAGSALKLKEVQDISLEKVSLALRAISSSSLEIRERTFNAAIAAMQHDGKISPDEEDLGRVLGLLFNIPVAPFSA